MGTSAATSRRGRRPSTSVCSGSSSRLRPILDSIPFSIVATDATGRIVSANAAAERLLGYGAAGAGRCSLAHRSTPSPARASGDWAALLAAALGAERERAYRRKDGAQVPVSEAITPLHGDDPDAAAGRLSRGRLRHHPAQADAGRGASSSRTTTR